LVAHLIFWGIMGLNECTW